MVLREEPYAAVVRAIFRVNHCAHCLKKIPTPVPCFECATVRKTLAFRKQTDANARMRFSFVMASLKKL